MSKHKVSGIAAILAAPITVIAFKYAIEPWQFAVWYVGSVSCFAAMLWSREQA